MAFFEILKLVKEQVKEVVKVIYEDKFGVLMMEDEVDELSPWEIEERQIHVFSEKEWVEL